MGACTWGGAAALLADHWGSSSSSQYSCPSMLMMKALYLGLPVSQQILNICGISVPVSRVLMAFWHLAHSSRWHCHASVSGFCII